MIYWNNELLGCMLVFLISNFWLIEWWGAGVVSCLEQGTDLHMAQLMPLPLTVSCFNKIQIGFTFLVLAHLGSPGKRAVCVWLVDINCLQCFDAVGWAAGRASGLKS